MAATTNDMLVNRQVRHAVYLQGYSTRQVDRFVGALNRDVLPDIEARMARMIRMGENPKRLARLRRTVKDIVAPGYAAAGGGLQTALRDFASAEATFGTKLLRQTIPVVVDLKTPSVRMLLATTERAPFQGMVLEEWFDDLSAKAQQRLLRDIRTGVAEGEGMLEISKRIKGTAAGGFRDGSWESILRQSQAVVRTAVTHFSTMAREASYAANVEVIKGVQYVATLDDRTTEICAALDGKVFKIGDGPRPPAHFNCRSTTVPVVKSWKELGIDLKEAPAGTRASMNGQVSAKVTYGEWLRKQPLAVQRNVLGKTKAELFSRGMVKIDRFTSRNNRPLTIKQIIKREGIPRDDVFSLRPQDVR